MRKLTLAAAAAIIAAGGMTLGAVGAGIYGEDYARDRALIADLQARYLFALDFGDPDSFTALFTEDGVLISGSGTAEGREALRAVAEQMGALSRGGEDGQRPSKGAHNITSIVIDVDGDRARSAAYWAAVGNNNPERSAGIGAYGHYEDELVKLGGRWYFAKRRVFNEQLDRSSAAGQPNPVRGLWEDGFTQSWTERQESRAPAQ